MLRFQPIPPFIFSFTVPFSYKKRVKRAEKNRLKRISRLHKKIFSDKSIFKMLEFKIELLNPLHTYFPGQNIEGRIIISLDKPKVLYTSYFISRGMGWREWLLYPLDKPKVLYTSYFISRGRYWRGVLLYPWIKLRYYIYLLLYIPGQGWRGG